MALTAQLLRDDRRAERKELHVAGTLRHVGNIPIDVVVEDLSATGFRMLTQANLQLGEKVTVGIPGVGQRAAHVVRHTDNGFSCEFVDAIDARLVTMPSTAQSVVEADFGRQLDVGLLSEWSRANPPQIERLSQSRRLLIFGGIGVAGWLIILGFITLL
ncbi:MAG: PilZ protein [Sphingomonadales bacterium]|jgi:hypothetical protein|nr:PilZ protein [Sphingomonadales bacterium]